MLDLYFIFINPLVALLLGQNLKIYSPPIMRFWPSKRETSGLTKIFFYILTFFITNFNVRHT